MTLTLLINFQNQRIPVYYSGDKPPKKALDLLMTTLENKLANGKSAIKRCLNSLISIEIEGSEAILHSKREQDTLALSLY